MSNKEKIELAFAAIGGSEYQKRNCQCDPDVGAVPCEYCAIFEALTVAQKAEAEVARLMEAGGELAEFVFIAGDFRLQRNGEYTKERNAYVNWQAALAGEGGK